MSLGFVEKTFVVGSFQCNCRCLVCASSGEAALIDPGDDPEQILRGLQSVSKEIGKQVRVRYLLHTHAHLDHIGATRAIKQALGFRTEEIAKIALHRADEPMYQALRKQGNFFGIDYEDPLPIDHYVQDEENFKIGKFELKAIHTPGHSPGGVCFELKNDSALGIKQSVFTGDTLFRGSIGRTDLWGANGDLLLKSIRTRLFTLDDDIRVCPGHGPTSSIGVEKRTNPFFV